MSSKKSKLLWSAAATAFVVALLLAWRFGNRPPAVDPFKPGTPLQTVEFPDGSKLEVFGLGIGEWTDGTIAPPSSSLFSMFATGTSGYSYGSKKNYLKAETRTSDDKLSGIKVFVPDKDLLLSLRFRSAIGMAVPPGETGVLKLRIELSDNHGNWISGYGPHGCPDDPFMRGVSGFEGWPRTGESLRFRAILDGGEPVEFQLPNPNYGNTPESWTAVSLPKTVSAPDWEITLADVFETRVPGQAPALVPNFTFTDKISNPSHEWPFIRLGIENVLGSRGTESDSHFRKSARRGLDTAYFMPQDEDLFKFRYTISRNENYPYPNTDFTIVAKAKVSPDGSKIDLIHTKSGLGITSIIFGSVTTPRHSNYGGKQSFEIEIERKFGNESEHRRVDAFLGDWRDVRVAVFTPSDSLPLGVVEPHSHGTAQSGHRGSYEWGGTWSGELTPGQELQIGFAKSIPDETCEIIVSRKDVKPLPENE